MSPASKTADVKVPLPAYGVIRIQSTASAASAAVESTIAGRIVTAPHAMFVCRSQTFAAALHTRAGTLIGARGRRLGVVPGWRGI